MPRGRHRHSSPLHRLLPPSAIAGVSVVCASAPWVFSEATVLRALAAAAAATAVVGAFVMRRWDVQAGRRVAELTRARAGDEWRFEERVAELETDLEESRELRAKLEQRLRAKRAELAGLRNEHAALLRRYATAETERASALEGRRLLELEATVPEPAPARPTAPALPPARSAEAAPTAPAVFSPEGARLYRRALTALARFEGRAPGEPGDGPEGRLGTATETASEGDEPGATGAGSRGTGSREAVSGEAVTGEAGAAGSLAGKPAVVETGAGMPGAVEPGAGAPGAATPVAGPARVPGQGGSGGEVPGGAATVAGSAAASGSAPVPGSAAASGSAPVPGSAPAPVAGAVSGAASASGVPSVAVGPVPEAPAPASGALTAPASPAAPDSQPAPAGPAQGVADRPGGAVDAVAPAGGPVVPAAGNFGVPPAVAVVPAAPARRPVTEGGFDFFGTQKEKSTPKAALDSVQNEDLADVVGPEALAVHKAEAEAGFKPADERSRGIGQIIDLTAHDETEQIDVQGLRSAAS
ncbi:MULTISPECIES: hypothetical protein [Streptomyces]|uniref:Secreted protein n=1 Tax=Streptomyces eurythermus TaxID=42237 RepID=A0ABW6Z629_9ACTN|nr:MULTISPECIES: hypothetical protein [Streptomyces]QIS72447.1 hypothetical protein HB370_22745 [Streptomyces sp. DSM 40868]